VTLNEYSDSVMIPAVLRMLGLPDTPAAREALERFTIAEMADMKFKGQLPAATITTTAEMIEKLRALDPIGAMPVFLRRYEHPGADGEFLDAVPDPVQGYARYYISTPEPCAADVRGAFPCIWLEA
jgi:hypothetical protein